MNEKIEGGAGPAIAAHSKDAAVAGRPNAPANANGSAGPHAGGISETVSDLAGQARDAAGQAAASVSDAAGAATQQVARQTARAADHAAEFVREQPLLALLATGTVCFMLGLLVSRR
jgi:ElaB/YqjD/DUF883 family membrane-anchored ribosome-binding protein